MTLREPGALFLALLALTGTATIGASLDAAASVAETSPRARTTAPEIALKNLDYSIRRSRRMLDMDPGNPALLAAHLDVLRTRVQFLNTFDDLDVAMELVERALRQRPEDPELLLERARLLHRLHDFDGALGLLDDLEQRLGDTPPALVSRIRPAIERQRLIIGLARGDAPGTLSGLARLPDGSAFADAALQGSALAATGNIAAGDAALVAALTHWDGITPFAIAWIEFQRGEIWVGHDDARAMRHYRSAIDYLPHYVTPQVHLAELLADAGDTAAAVALLEPLADGPDPEPAARLAEFLEAAGELDAAQRHRQTAARGWEQLLERHPLAFADHGAEFWLGAGNDPARALQWAQRNHANRATEGALALVLEASVAADADPCAVLAAAPEPVRAGKVIDPGLAATLETIAPGCNRSG